MSKVTTNPGVRKMAAQLRQHPLVTLREEMDDLMSRFFGGSEEGWFTGVGTPAVDIAETDNAVEIYFDVPGIDPEEVDLHLTGNSLTMTVERKDIEEKGRTFHRVERRKGKMRRSVALPCAVVEGEAVAEYKDGVLTVTLPKCQEARTHKIAVKH